MNVERAIALLSDGVRMPATPHSAEELDEACRMACEALRRIRLSIETPVGDLVAEPSTDPEHPGIWVSLHKPGEEYEPTLALVEYTKDEADQGRPALITRVWRNTEQDEYTDRIVHTGLERGGAE